MPETFRFVITEHAAWRITERGRHRVFALPDGGQWLVRVSGSEVLSCPLVASTGEPRFDVFALPRPGMARREAPELFSALAALGTVARFRTSDLWEAIATAIIRQVVRAAQAKRLYRDFCQVHGQRVTHLNGEGYALFPAAETVLGLHDEQFASIGLTLKRRPLRAAAKRTQARGALARPAACRTSARASAHTAYRAVDGWRCRGRLQQRLYVLPLRGPGRPHLGQASRTVISMAR